MKTNRKEFLKASALLGLGALALKTGATELVPSKNVTTAGGDVVPVDGKFSLAPLGYAYNSLEPYIDATTMEIHHSKHHQAYVNKLNEAIASEPSLAGKSLEQLLYNVSDLPSSVKKAVRNHGGGHWNHTFFWSILKTGTQPGPVFTKMATESFGNMETFKSTFEKVAMGVFGSGWAWVTFNYGKLQITTSPNQDNPLMDTAKGNEPRPAIILGIDLWEHAYYLKHQNRRADYVGGFWNVVNWDEVEKRLKG